MQAFRFLFLICILKSRPQKDRIRFLHWHKHFVCHFDLRFCFASFSVTKNITGFCHLTLTHTNIFLSPFYFYPRCRTFFISLKQLLLLSFWLCRVLGISENDGTTWVGQNVGHRLRIPDKSLGDWCVAFLKLRHFSYFYSVQLFVSTD